MAITKEQIFKVADELVAAGQTPTLAKVRAALGGGSYSTINGSFAEWKSQQAAKAAQPALEPAPEAVRELTRALAADVWALALTMANARLAVDRESLEAERAAANAARQDAAELADQVAGELEASQLKCHELTRLLEQHEAEVVAGRGELAAAAGRVAVAEARAAEIERRANDLKSALEAAQEGARVQATEFVELLKKLGNSEKPVNG